MRTLSIAFAIALVGLGNAQAQEPTKGSSMNSTHADHCVMATTEADWTALGLSAEQQSKVMGIQTKCKTDCAAMDASGAKEPALSQALMEKHQEQIRTALTPEQYKQWLTWCGDRSRKG